jgi:hypothetical protein
MGKACITFKGYFLLGQRDIHYIPCPAFYKFINRLFSSGKCSLFFCLSLKIADVAIVAGNELAFRNVVAN